jgi:hypothetical protein
LFIVWFIPLFVISSYTSNHSVTIPIQCRQSSKLRSFIPANATGNFGRIARVGYPAAFGVKRSIERQLRKTDYRLVVADSGCYQHETQASALAD